MGRIVVDVMLKPEILDPQGQAVAGALPRLGFDGIVDVLKAYDDFVIIPSSSGNPTTSPAPSDERNPRIRGFHSSQRQDGVKITGM